MTLNARLLRIPLSLLLSCWLLLAAYQAVLADSYDVNAVVPYPAPTQPATFDGSLDGTTVHDALLTLTGTCQLQNPATTVSIYRDTTVLGSAICNGTYTIQVMLTEGSNTLIARTANASQLYAPDSQPITVTLVLPEAPPAPTPVTNPQAATPEQVTTNTNAAAASDLTATPTEPFSTLDSGNAVTLHVTVGGGQSPYTITLNWGDGSVETRTVPEPGVYEFSHTYQTNGNYMVHGTTHDVLGAMTEFQYAVVTPKAAPVTVKPTETSTDTPLAGPSIIHKLLPVAGGTGIVAIAIGGYWIGAHHAAQQAVVKSTQALRARKQGVKHRSYKLKHQRGLKGKR